jgi:hypothetical protein
MKSLISGALERGRNDTLKMAKDYANSVTEAIKVLGDLENALIQPAVEFDSRQHLKVTLGGDCLVDGKRIVIIYSYADKKPIYAYLKDPEKEAE